jgi:hypothetical protein
MVIAAKKAKIDKWVKYGFERVEYAFAPLAEFSGKK